MQRISKYMSFYFEGRGEEIDQDDLDIDQLAKTATDANESPYSIALRAVEKIATPLAEGRERREWSTDYKDEIAAVPDCDPNVAYEHFLQGRIEQTAAVVEDEMLEKMDPREVAEPEGDPDADDDDDEDEDDDDDYGDDDGDSDDDDDDEDDD